MRAQRNELGRNDDQMQQWTNKRLDRLAEAAASGEYAGWEDQGRNRMQGEYNDEEDEAPHEIQEEETGEEGGTNKSKN